MEDLWIETCTGRRVNPLRMSEGDICIEDIALALSKICRFGGHTRDFYSVAQHSLLVVQLILHFQRDVDKLTQRAALLHDAAEAYIGDIPRPIKHSSAGKELVEAEKRIMGQITKVFGLGGADWQLIKQADNAMLVAEAEVLMPSSAADWWELREYKVTVPDHIQQVLQLNAVYPTFVAEDFLTAYNGLKL